MPQGYARSRGFRGNAELRPTLERNDRGLSSYLNGYVPSYEKDGTTLVLRGNLQVPGSISIAAGATVDGVDPSAHTHSGMGSNGQQVDHGNLLGNADDDHTQYLNGTRHTNSHPGSRVGRATDYTIATATTEIIPWTSELFDDDGWHSNATNPSRVTVATAGWYHISSGVQWSTATGAKQIRMLVNGSSVGRYTSPSGEFVAFATAYKLAANDYVETQVNQISGGNADVIAGVNSFLTVVRLG